MASFSNCGYAAIISSLPADFGAPSRTTYTSRPLTHTNGAEWGNSRSGLCGHDPFVRGIRLAWPSTGPGCGRTDDSSAPCWSVYAEDRLTGRLTLCGN